MGGREREEEQRTSEQTMTKSTERDNGSVTAKHESMERNWSVKERRVATELEKHERLLDTESEGTRVWAG